MVDQMKKQMCRFEYLIGFSGRLDVTSRESMARLIDALGNKYKSDVQNSLRLHRLEFFRDLVESRRSKIEHSETAEGARDPVMTVQAEDIDDWKDLMSLSRIYYVLEHPRSEGLGWKRRVSKKKVVERFGDTDLIEWRVAQSFRLRGLEEWAQRRSDARRLAEISGYLPDDDDDDDDEESSELDELFQLFDPSEKKVRGGVKKEKKKRPTVEKRPFKFQDECLEDWTESYSEDSELTDIEDIGDEFEEFPVAAEDKLGELEQAKRSIPKMEEEGTDLSDLLATQPSGSPYREPIFIEMDECETFPEWSGLYQEQASLFQKSPEAESGVESMQEVRAEEKALDRIGEEDEEEDRPEETTLSAIGEETGEEEDDDRVEEKASDRIREDGEGEDQPKETTLSAVEEEDDDRAEAPDGIREDDQPIETTLSAIEGETGEEGDDVRAEGDEEDDQPKDTTLSAIEEETGEEDEDWTEEETPDEKEEVEETDEDVVKENDEDAEESASGTATQDSTTDFTDEEDD